MTDTIEKRLRRDAAEWRDAAPDWAHQVEGGTFAEQMRATAALEEEAAAELERLRQALAESRAHHAIRDEAEARLRAENASQAERIRGSSTMPA
jgi:hypothetical protein